VFSVAHNSGGVQVVDAGFCFVNVVGIWASVVNSNVYKYICVYTSMLDAAALCVYCCCCCCWAAPLFVACYVRVYIYIYKDR
jgi:hypothetical protein